MALHEELGRLTNTTAFVSPFNHVSISDTFELFGCSGPLPAVCAPLLVNIPRNFTTDSFPPYNPPPVAAGPEFI